MLVGDLLDLTGLLERLQPSDYHACQRLFLLHEAHQPEIGPLPLSDLVPGRESEFVALLCAGPAPDSPALLHYCRHLLLADQEAALLLLHRTAPDFPPAAILFLLVAWWEEHLPRSPGPQLEAAVSLEWSEMVVRCLAAHLPGWPHAWDEILSLHPGLAEAVTEAFTEYNVSRLGRLASLVGAHTSEESREVAALGELLLQRVGSDAGPAFCRATTFLPGLVRLAMQDPELAGRELPLLVELGDTQLLADCGLLEPHMAPALLDHLTQLYHGPGCPLPWPSLASALLARAGPVLTLQEPSRNIDTIQ